jgi:hypothetical protein
VHHAPSRATILSVAASVESKLSVTFCDKMHESHSVPRRHPENTNEVYACIYRCYPILHEFLGSSGNTGLPHRLFVLKLILTVGSQYNFQDIQRDYVPNCIPKFSESISPLVSELIVKLLSYTIRIVTGHVVNRT